MEKRSPPTLPSTDDVADASTPTHRSRKLRGGRCCRSPVIAVRLVAALAVVVVSCVGLFRELPPQPEAPVAVQSSVPPTPLPTEPETREMKGSQASTLPQLRGLPFYEISSEEAKDVFLMRPNWRRAAVERTPYVYYGADADGRFDEEAYRKSVEAQETVNLDEKTKFTFHKRDRHEGERFDNINAKLVRDEEDDEQIRVFIAFYTSKMDSYLCGFFSSAYLLSLPVNNFGYKHEHTNFTEKIWGLRYSAYRAGLRPQDVLLYFDADVMMQSSEELVRTIDRFIRYSPETPEELDARDVRDQAGEMMAPVLISAECGCMYLNLLGLFHCERGIREFGVGAFDEYMNKTFPGKEQYTPLKDFMFRFLNMGGIIARMWAWEEYVEGFRKFTQELREPIPRSRDKRNGWVCDQSATGGIHAWLLKHEAAIDIFHPTNYDEAEGKPPQYPRDKTGLRAGLIGVDHYNEFFQVLHAAAYWVKLNDRLWQATALAVSGTYDKGNADGVLSWMALQQEQRKMFALSYTGKSLWARELGGASVSAAGGVPFTLEVSRRYFSRRTTRTDGLEDERTGESKGVRSRVIDRSYAPYKGHCLVEAFYRVSAGIAPPSITDNLQAVNAQAAAMKRLQEVEHIKRVLSEEQHALRDVPHNDLAGIKKATEAVTKTEVLLSLAEQQAASAVARAEASAEHARASAEKYGPAFTIRDPSAASRSIPKGSPLPNASTLNCYESPSENCKPCRAIDWFSQPRSVDEDGKALHLFHTVPLYLSRTPDATSIEIAPPSMMYTLFYETGHYTELFHPRAPTNMVYQVPTIVHTPGGRKGLSHVSAFYMSPWAAPLYYGVENKTSGKDPDADIAKVKRFLLSSRLQLWGDDFRTTKPYGDVCMNYMNLWFMNRKERAVKHPWPV